MPDDKEIAKRALDLRSRARDYRLLDIPSYKIWSQRRLREGASEALIAHLDAMSRWLLPEDVAAVSDAIFDEMLEDLQSESDHGA